MRGTLFPLLKKYRGQEMNISEVILCKYGEVVLKGANRQSFESSLIKELRRRASPHGSFKIYFKQSIVYIEPQDTPETLQKRVMQEAEWIILPEAVEKVSKDPVVYALTEKGKKGCEKNIFAL